MSRYTRWLRKQARAKSQRQGSHSGFLGGCAVEEAAEPIGTLGELGTGPFGDSAQEWAQHSLGDEAEGVIAPERSPATPASVWGMPLPSVEPALPVAPDPADGDPAREFSSGGVLGRDYSPAIGLDHPQPSCPERWLWRDKILLGDLVVVVGDQSAGKTRLLTDWIARVTVGRPFPGTADPAHALPPSDVLVFNSVDDFDEAVLDQVSRNGGDPRRVLQASTQLLDWGYSHPEFPRGKLPLPEIAGGEAPETRVRLHTREVLEKLQKFLEHRPTLRLVVIDQLKQYLRTDSERVFEDLVYELQAIGRMTGVVFVLSQRPDAFRNATGVKQYLKSDSLTGVARSIWRVARPDDPAHGHRVLECLKLGYGYNDSGKEPWRLWQNPGQPMRWEVGNGLEFPLGKLDARHRILFHAKTYISLYLQMFGGLADFETLRFWARKEGITGAKLFEASIAYDFGYEYEACDDNEIGLRKVIGSWDDIRKRQAIPEEDRPPVVGPSLPRRRRRPQGPVPATSPADSLAPFPATASPPLVPSNPAVPSSVACVPPPSTSVRAPVMPIPASRPPTPRPTPAQVVESLRARVARGEAALKEFNLEGFRFMKPNLAACHLLLNLEAELGSEEAMIEHMRMGLEGSKIYSAEDLQTFLAEYRRLFRIARQIEADNARPAAA